MSLFSYLNKDKVIITKLQNFVQTKKFSNLMKMLAKSEITSSCNQLVLSSPNGATSITILDSKIIIDVDPRENLDLSARIEGYPYKLMTIAVIELDFANGTYSVVDVDTRFHSVIDRTMDDLNYIFYQGELS